MTKVERHLKSLRGILSSLKDNGTLEQRQIEALERAMKLLGHGLQFDDLRAVKAAIRKIVAVVAPQANRP